MQDIDHIDIDHTRTLKPDPTLTRFYAWVKQRKGYGLSPLVNKIRQNDHTQNKEKEKKYVTSYSE